MKELWSLCPVLGYMLLEGVISDGIWSLRRVLLSPFSMWFTLYLATCSEGFHFYPVCGVAHLFYKLVSAWSGDETLVYDAHHLLAVSLCGDPLCSRRGQFVKLIATSYFLPYTGLCSRWLNLLSLGKEYFCLEVDMLSECYERLTFYISFRINLYLH